MLNRIADRVDLAIDVLTLGQYGLEQEHTTAATGCEGIGKARRQAGWETRTQSGRRRGDCVPHDPAAAVSWDWPRGPRGAIS